MEADHRTDPAIPSNDRIADTSTGPQGPVPAPCPQGGIHRPAPPPPQLGVETEDESRNGHGSRYTATYSPDDNKLRLYTSTRLDRETYERVKAIGFKWAPKQDLFVAPMWTPQREDLLIELCGEVGDEDTSLVDRSEQRSERFDGYRERRAADADAAHKAVAAIADGIPMGQPILVGHHSERHARRDAERIENGMRRAVRMWETSKYWQSRAAGAIRHAKYKELPAVRARRIKTIEADQRKQQRDKAKCETFLPVWERLQDPESLTRKDGVPTTFAERVARVASLDQCYQLWSDLEAGKVTPEDAQARRIKGLKNLIAHAERWIAHFDNRLAYERAMLAESGYVPPAKPKTKADLPLINYSGIVAYRSQWRDEVTRSEAVGMTKAELAKIHTDYKGTALSECRTHRVRTAMIRRPGAAGLELFAVFLTDSKQHPRPTAQAEAFPGPALPAYRAPREPRPRDPREEAFGHLKNQLRTGVKVVSAPQLFPTPSALAARMVAEAGIEPGQRVLEPSAGTGAILRAIADAEAAPFGAGAAANVVAVEINQDLANALPKHLATHVVAADFMSCTGLGSFDRIVMNPPFAHGADIAHIKHAIEMLAPGGRLVAVCADGQRQAEHLKPLATSWEPLPADTFKAQGTQVRTVLLVVEARS